MIPGALKSQPDPAGSSSGLLRGVVFLKQNQAGKQRRAVPNPRVNPPGWNPGVPRKRGHIPGKGRPAGPGPECSGRERPVGLAQLDLPEEEEKEEEEEEEEKCRSSPGGIPEFQESGDPRGVSKLSGTGKNLGREPGDPNSWEKGIDCSKLP